MASILCVLSHCLSLDSETPLTPFGVREDPPYHEDNWVAEGDALMMGNWAWKLKFWGLSPASSLSLEDNLEI